MLLHLSMLANRYFRKTLFTNSYNVKKKTMKKKFNKSKQIQINKLQRLVAENDEANTVGNLDNIKNYSTTVIPDNLLKLLSLGPKFAVQPLTKEMDVNNFLADVECGIAKLDISEHDKDIKRNEAVSIITNFKFDKAKNNRITPGQKQFEETRKFLRRHENLIIMNSDKGNVTVVLGKQQYKEKLDEIVQDTDVYTRLRRDPTEVYQRKANDLVKEMFTNQLISDKIRKNLNRWNSQTPNLYGSLKCHKLGLPLRPMVSCIDCPTTNLSKFITDILNNVTHLFSFNVKNSFEASEQLKNVVLPPNYTLISYDEVSLFTNIKKPPISNHWIEISKHTQLTEVVFLKIDEFVFDQSFF